MKKNNQSKSVFTISGRHRFVACVILVILVSYVAFAYLSVNSSENIGQLQALLDKHQERQEALLQFS